MIHNTYFCIFFLKNLESSDILAIYANKYRRYVVKTALAYGPESLGAGWRYDQIA